MSGAPTPPDSRDGAVAPTSPPGAAGDASPRSIAVGSHTPGPAGAPSWPGVIEAYRHRLDVTDATPVVSLGEGDTPLVRSERLSAETGCEVLLKFEGANPTGSFKDRGMTLAISKAVEQGAEAVLCASTGNTSASAAAYAAAAGITCGVIVPAGKVALGKLAQALVHGATVLQIEGNFDQALTVSREVCERYPVELVNSVNPHRIEGQRTAAFEIVDAIGRAPDVHIMPVGNAGNITAYWRAYRELHEEGAIDRPPVMRGWQALGASPIVRGRRVEHPSTIATAIRIGNPASWTTAVEAAEASGGSIRAVSDRDILRAYREVARHGLFCEMASAASVAGLRQLAATGELPEGATVVCVLTGHGLKDTDWAITGAAQPPVVPAEVDATAEALGVGS